MIRLVFVLLVLFLSATTASAAEMLNPIKATCHPRVSKNGAMVTYKKLVYPKVLLPPGSDGRLLKLCLRAVGLIGSAPMVNLVPKGEDGENDRPAKAKLQVTESGYYPLDEESAGAEAEETDPYITRNVENKSGTWLWATPKVWVIEADTECKEFGVGK